MQVEQLENERREMQNKMKTLARRIDHTERAYRQEEIPLIAASYEKRKQEGKELHEQAHTQLLEATKRQHEIDLAAKKRMLRMKGDYEAFKKNLAEKHKVEVEQLRLECAKKLEAAKLKRIDDLKAKKKADLAKKLKAEEDARIKAEEERIKLEEAKAEKEGMLSVAGGVVAWGLGLSVCVCACVCVLTYE